MVDLGLAQCAEMEKAAMLHDASEGRYPAALLRSNGDGTYRVADNLLQGRSVAVFVWATQRKNENRLQRVLFARSREAECRPDHMCITLVAEDAWRYSLGLVYSGQANRHPVARLLQPLPKASKLAENLNDYTSKAITPDWPLAEAITGALARQQGLAPDPRKPVDFDLVAIGRLSEHGRQFLQKLASAARIERKGQGFDIFDEELLGRFRKLTSVSAGGPSLHNCASFVELVLPELVDCTSRSFVFKRFLGYRMPVFCRTKQTSRVTCARKNASHTIVSVAEDARGGRAEEEDDGQTKAKRRRLA
jgi:hypothetical protein